MKSSYIECSPAAIAAGVAFLILTIPFLGNNYTGAYCNIPSIMSSLRDESIDKALIAHYSRVMIVGCPNNLNATTMPYWLPEKVTTLPSTP